MWCRGEKWINAVGKMILIDWLLQGCTNLQFVTTTMFANTVKPNIVKRGTLPAGVSHRSLFSSFQKTVQFYSVFCHKCDGTCSDLGVFFIMLRKFFFILRLLNSFYPESKLAFLKALMVLFYLVFPFLKWLYRFPFGLLVRWIINFLDVKPGLHYWDKLQWSYYYPF